MKKKTNHSSLITYHSINIDHVAKLANLPLVAKEKQQFEKQLSAVLDYFKNLQKLNTEKVEPIGQITGLENIVREDETTPSLSQEEAISQAPKTHNGFVEVKAIFEERDT